MNSVAQSLQQIKFECLTYIKEFGANGSEWMGGTCADPRHTLFEVHGVDEQRDIWCWKPALSPAAARAAAIFLRDRFGVQQTARGEEGACVFLYKKIPC